MRQHHVAGEKAFVDYSGKRIGIVDPTTGEIREAEIFVGVLGASNLTYAEATWTQQLPDWTGAHVRMFGFFGGTPKLLVPDNLKSGVNKASFYDPEINRTYGAMAAHYSVGVLPARPGKPRDKAKVEAGVRFAQTYILGRLRGLTFFSLAEMQRGDRARHATHERPSHAQPRPEPSRAVREDRARRPHRLARRGLGVRGMAARAGQSRLSHRGP
jgi:transposase